MVKKMICKKCNRWAIKKDSVEFLNCPHCGKILDADDFSDMKIVSRPLSPKEAYDLGGNHGYLIPGRRTKNIYSEREYRDDGRGRR